MSHWIHCNKCFKQPESGAQPPKYHLTNCGHVLCDSCLQRTKQICVSRQLPMTCCVCSKRDINVVAVNASMDSRLKAYFVDANRHWQQQLARMTRFAVFQSQQAAQLKNVVVKQRGQLMHAKTVIQKAYVDNKKLEKEVKTKEVNAKHYQGQLEQTSEELESLRKRVRQLEDELQRRNETSTDALLGNELNSSGESADFSYAESARLSPDFGGNNVNAQSTPQAFVPFGDRQTEMLTASARSAPALRQRPVEEPIFATPSFSTTAPSSVGSGRSFVSALQTPSDLADLRPQVMASFSSASSASSKRPLSSAAVGSGSGRIVSKNRIACLI